MGREMVVEVEVEVAVGDVLSGSCQPCFRHGLPPEIVADMKEKRGIYLFVGNALRICD